MLSTFGVSFRPSRRVPKCRGRCMKNDYLQCSEGAPDFDYQVATLSRGLRCHGLRSQRPIAVVVFGTQHINCWVRKPHIIPKQDLRG